MAAIEVSRKCPACGNSAPIARPCRVCAHDPRIVESRNPDQFDRFTGGEISAHQIVCVLCGGSATSACICPPFGSPEYFALLDQRHGKR